MMEVLRQNSDILRESFAKTLEFINSNIGERSALEEETNLILIYNTFEQLFIILDLFEAK